MIEAAKIAKERDLVTVSVTRFNKNELSQIVNVPLYFYGEPRQVNGYNVDDRTGLMVLLRELSEIFGERTVYKYTVFLFSKEMCGIVR